MKYKELSKKDKKELRKFVKESVPKYNPIKEKD